MSRHDDDVMGEEEFAEVRAALGLAVPPVSPPPGMKDAVMARIAQTPQLAPQAAIADGEARDAPTGASPSAAGSAETRARARWFSRAALVVTSAAAAVALFFGGVLAADLLLPGSSSSAEQLASIVAAPDVTTLVSEVAGGGTATLVSSASAGLAAMVFDGLEPLSDEERYALWYITDGTPVPAGLFAVDGAGAVVQILDGEFVAGTVVGVTVEPATGSPLPTRNPIVAIATA